MRALLAVAIATLAFSSSANAAVNLVTNGDFEGGNANFASDYDYIPPNVENTQEGQYTVTNNAYPWNPYFVNLGDHTSGGGNALILLANGSGTEGDVVWESTEIAIASNTQYFFEAFVANVCCNSSYPGSNSAPILTFSVSLDGDVTDLATLTIPLNPAGQWHGLSTNFNSGGATTATLRLINANTAPAGNDFAVDDIFLGTESIVPEPATWAMMIAGFGAVGGAMRRRRPMPALAS